MTLAEKKCVLCEGGVDPLDQPTAEKYLKEVPGWSLDKENTYISRKYIFKGFGPTMLFINALAFIAQREGHHPDVEFGYNYCVIKFTTHAIKGLSENDFICAAKVNELTN